MAITLVAKVLLTVLKVVLFLLLAVILILLLILCLVLFTPLKYNIYAEKYNAIKAEGKISWLLGIVSFSFCCSDGGNSYKLKIFGADYKKLEKFLAKFFKKKEKKVHDLEFTEKPVTKKTFKDKNESRKKDYEKKEEIETFPQKKENFTIDKDKTPARENKENTWEDKTPQKDAEVEEKNKEIKKAVQHNKDSRTDKDKRASHTVIPAIKKFFKKIKLMPVKIRIFWNKTIRKIKGLKEKLQKFKEEIQKIPETAHKYMDKLERIKEFLFSEITKNMFIFAKAKLFYLLKKIKPRKIKSDILIGTGNPCQTGQILGAAAVYMAMSGTFFNITPDFENKVFSGRILVSGHIRAVTLATVVLKVIISNEWKSFYKEAMKIKEEF